VFGSGIVYCIPITGAENFLSSVAAAIYFQVAIRIQEKVVRMGGSSWLCTWRILVDGVQGQVIQASRLTPSGNTGLLVVLLHSTYGVLYCQDAVNTLPGLWFGSRLFALSVHKNYDSQSYHSDFCSYEL
jgi:hypothetical protein